jgi:hypothetical protein
VFVTPISTAKKSRFGSADLKIKPIFVPKIKTSLTRCCMLSGNQAIQIGVCIFLISFFQSCAYCSANEWDRFCSEAKQRWAKYEAAAPVFQQKGTYEIVEKFGAVTERLLSKTEIRRRAGCVYGYTERHLDLIDEKKSTYSCLCLNPRYAFTVKRHQPDSEWFLTTLVPGGASNPKEMFAAIPSMLTEKKVRELSLIGISVIRVVAQLGTKSL